MLVTLNGTTMSGARVPFAVARDGYFFSALAKVHPRFHTPSTSIIVQAIVAILLLLLVGSFKQLFSLAIFAEWLFYMIAGSTIFVFRRRESDSARPFRIWGYPIIPAFFVCASALLLYFTFTDNLLNSTVGLLIILAGIPVFYGFARKRSVSPRAAGYNSLIFWLLAGITCCYQSPTAPDTFTPRPTSRTLETPTPCYPPRPGPQWCFWRKIEWPRLITISSEFCRNARSAGSTLASSYGLLVLFILAIISVGLIWPDRIELKKNFHLTELIPIPSDGCTQAAADQTAQSGRKVIA